MEKKVYDSNKNDTTLTGLLVRGTVKGRTRRQVPLDNPTTEIVTYTVSDENDHRYYVDDFAPSTYYSVGESIESNVYVKPYRKRNGSLSYTLCIQKDYHSMKGEAF